MERIINAVKKRISDLKTLSNGALFYLVESKILFFIWSLSNANLKIDRFLNSCSLYSSFNKNHKVIITPPAFSDYDRFEYYSCSLSNFNYCFINEE